MATEQARIAGLLRGMLDDVEGGKYGQNDDVDADALLEDAEEMLNAFEPGD